MSDKTEQPTPKKLRDARKKGQIAKSREIPSAAIVVGIFMYLWIGWDFIMENLKEMVILPARYDMEFEDALGYVISGIFNKLLVLSLPVLGVAILMAVLSNYAQVGAMFTLETIKPDLKKIDPASGIKKIFSLNNLIDLLKSIIKIVFLAIVIRMVILDSIDMLMKLPYMGSAGIIPILSVILKRLVLYTTGAFIVISAADWFWQRYQHIKQLKMSKDEVKREYKEMEGDPIIKGKRKQLHQEMVMNDTTERTRKASVVVTNPTHIAVGLYYDKEKTPLPVVITKGENLMAKRIIEIAKEEGIPIMQNLPLARELYANTPIDHFIPSDLIEPVAEVLRWVQQLQMEKQNR